VRARLVFWPIAMSYLCFLVAGNATYAPQSFVGGVLGAALGVACALVFFRRAKRYEHRELARLLLRR
jgi:hypothetical protein